MTAGCPSGTRFVQSSRNDSYLTRITAIGQVYDVTEWIHKHPGGADMIRLNGGKDATMLFEVVADTTAIENQNSKCPSGLSQ